MKNGPLGSAEADARLRVMHRRRLQPVGSPIDGSPDENSEADIRYSLTVYDFSSFWSVTGLTAFLYIYNFTQTGEILKLNPS